MLEITKSSGSYEKEDVSQNLVYKMEPVRRSRVLQIDKDEENTMPKDKIIIKVMKIFLSSLPGILIVASIIIPLHLSVLKDCIDLSGSSILDAGCVVIGIVAYSFFKRGNEEITEEEKRKLLSTQ